MLVGLAIVGNLTVPVVCITSSLASKSPKGIQFWSPGVSIKMPPLKIQDQSKAKWEHANRAKTIDKAIKSEKKV